MPRASRTTLVLTLLTAFCAGAGLASAQPAAEAARDRRADAEAALNAYLQDLELSSLLALQLERQLDTTIAPNDRIAIAERLAETYVQLLDAARTPAERADLEQRSRSLLDRVPEADTFALRLNLLKAIYAPAEELMERARLRLASDEERAEAQSTLRNLQPRFDTIASRLHREVERLEAREKAGEESIELSDALAEARRLRSLAFYFSGWCSYYTAWSTGSDRAAVEALKSFGWLLNSSGGKLATVERLPEALLRYEHIARAATACALCESIRGNDAEAIRWLDAVDRAEDVAPAVRDQLLLRRISVLARAKRWGDLERAVRISRREAASDDPTSDGALQVGPARLLAVEALEADPRLAGEVLERLAVIALGDLVTRGEVGHVLDLVDRYGTAPIGETGFIVNYVRGFQAYERARQVHSAAAVDADVPSSSPEVVNAYREAVELLSAALAQADVEGFGRERLKASMLCGLSHYYAGDLLKAAERFESTAGLASEIGPAARSQAEEALWLAIVAIDRAADAAGLPGRVLLDARRDRLATLFLQTHPDSERAATLLIRQAASGLLGDEEAVRVLLAVEKSSPTYEAARRHAATILYRLYRGASEDEKAFAAARYIPVGEEVFAMDQAAALSEDRSAAAEAGARSVVRARQLLDALLGAATADPDRAEAVLDAIDRVAAVNGLSLDEYEAELTFRRAQIALARDDDEAAARHIEALRDAEGPYAEVAQRLLFRRAMDRWRRDESSVEWARRVVDAGALLLGRSRSAEGENADPVRLTMSLIVAEAAAMLWTNTGDAAMRDLALRLDEEVLRLYPGNEESLVRTARLAEAAERDDQALEAWRVLMSGRKPGTDLWYEARYESLRLLAKVDLDRARTVMRQHVVLEPEYGPEPWGGRLEALDREMGPGTEPTE